MRFKPFFQIQNTPLDPQVSFLLLPFSLERAAVCLLVTFAQQLTLLTLSFMGNVPPNTRKQSGQWLTMLPGLSQGPFTTSLVAQTGKNPPVVQETWVPSLGRKIPWRREWHPIAVFLPGEFHGQRSLAGYSPWGRKVGHDWVTNTSFMRWQNPDSLTIWGIAAHRPSPGVGLELDGATESGLWGLGCH